VGYGWPGNIRQLANTIERAVILEDDKIIHPLNLSLPGMANDSTSGENGGEGRDKNDASLAEREYNLILAVLEECMWVQKHAAKKLGISPRSLNYKINKFGITHPDWPRNS
jgi:DNA-binding NtrC family response regulator